MKSSILEFQSRIKALETMLEEKSIYVKLLEKENQTLKDLIHDNSKSIFFFFFCYLIILIKKFSDLPSESSDKKFDVNSFIDNYNESMIVAPNVSIASALKKPPIIANNIDEAPEDDEQIINHPISNFDNKYDESAFEDVLAISIDKKIEITDDSEHFLALSLKVKNISSFKIQQFKIAKKMNGN